MKNEEILLCDLPLGQRASVVTVSGGKGENRFSDIGLVAGTVVEALYKSPCGNPVAYKIRGAVIALRNEDAAGVTVNFKKSVDIE